MQALLTNLNDATFTPVSSITDEAVTKEAEADINRTIDVMEKQEHIEVVTDENGSRSLRLTPSGVALVNMFNQGGV